VSILRLFGKETKDSTKDSHVRTSVRDGRKYVDPNDLLRLEKVQQQIKKLQNIVANERWLPHNQG
jgi:hypothetical protein